MLQDALDRLTPKQRAVVVLRYLDDLSECDLPRCSTSAPEPSRARPASRSAASAAVAGSVAVLGAGDHHGTAPPASSTSTPTVTTAPTETPKRRVPAPSPTAGPTAGGFTWARSPPRKGSSRTSAPRCRGTSYVLSDADGNRRVLLLVTDGWLPFDVSLVASLERRRPGPDVLGGRRAERCDQAGAAPAPGDGAVRYGRSRVGGGTA